MDAPAFSSRLRIEELDDDNFLLLEPLVYRSAIPGVGTITVPAGFVSDGCSVPRVPGAYWLMGGRARRAGVVHDWLYRNGLLTREICDAVFKEALAVLGQPSWRVDLMWGTVRTHGAQYYKGAPDPVPDVPSHHVEA